MHLFSCWVTCFGALRQTVRTAAFVQIIDNSSISIFITELFKYLGTTLRNQNSIQEEINTLRTGDADLRFYIKTVQDG